MRFVFVVLIVFIFFLYINIRLFEVYFKVDWIVEG